MRGVKPSPGERPGRGPRSKECLGRRPRAPAAHGSWPIAGRKGVHKSWLGRPPCPGPNRPASPQDRSPTACGHWRLTRLQDTPPRTVQAGLGVRPQFPKSANRQARPGACLDARLSHSQSPWPFLPRIVFHVRPTVPVAPTDDPDPPFGHGTTPARTGRRLHGRRGVQHRRDWSRWTAASKVQEGFLVGTIPTPCDRLPLGFEPTRRASPNHSSSPLWNKKP